MKVTIMTRGERVSAYVQAALRITQTGSIRPGIREISVNVSPFYLDLLLSVCEAAAVTAGGYPYDVRIVSDEEADDQ